MAAPPGISVREHHAGHGPLVVLVHGTMDRATSFARVGRLLEELSVVTYDRRGYGGSVGAQPPAMSLDDHVNDLVAIIDGRRCVVVGHSFGGVIALSAAFRHPALIAAVGAFEPPTPWLPSWSPDRESTAATSGGDGDPATAVEQFFRYVAGDASWSALPERTKHDRRSEGPALVTDIRTLHEGVPPWQPEDLRDTPVFLGAGTRSWPHQIANVRYLAATIGAPLTWIDGATHGAHLSHPGPFADWVHTVVAGADVGASTWTR